MGWGRTSRQHRRARPQDRPNRAARNRTRARRLSSRAGSAKRRWSTTGGKKDPTITADLAALIDPHLGGDPEGQRVIVRKSRRSLAELLEERPSENVAGEPTDSPTDRSSSHPETTANNRVDPTGLPSGGCPLEQESTEFNESCVQEGVQPLEAAKPFDAGEASVASFLETPTEQPPTEAIESTTSPSLEIAGAIDGDEGHGASAKPEPERETSRPRASPNTIARLLKKLKISLKSNFKRLTGKPHPDRDKQFRYIQRVRALFHRRGEPTASIDAKKSELIGDFKNPGQTYCSEPEPVNVYDFRSLADYRATAYGIYDTAANHALVVVGISVITGMFAVASIRRWWLEIGQPRYPKAKTLMLEADGGGCNGHRLRLWKWELQKLADETGLEILVCHYPTGASKWNPIEHRVFGQITKNWAGEVLRTLDKMLALIRGAGTETGLVIEAELDESTYEKGIKITDKQMKTLNIHPRKICPKWNYIIKPQNSGSNC